MDIRQKDLDIPLDIRKMAVKVYDALGRGMADDERTVARAILAERARCAKIVEADMEDVFRCYGPGEVTGVIRSRFEYIAATIRKGEPHA